MGTPITNGCPFCFSDNPSFQVCLQWKPSYELMIFKKRDGRKFGDYEEKQ